MASKEKVDLLNDKIKTCLELLNKELVSRPDWGKVTFQNADTDLKRTKDILSYLKVLPIENLPDNAVSKIVGSIDHIFPVLKQIDDFNIENQGSPQRDAITDQLHTTSDEFYSHSGHWIPFLAYQQGDVATNIAKLSKAVEEAKTIISNAQAAIKVSQGEIDNIITAAREASAKAGAAVFTQDFQNESESLAKSSNYWLISAIVFFLISVGYSAFIWFIPTSKDWFEFTHNFIVKLVILSLLITATIWCANQYKTLKHLATLNHHRSLSLKTLQAFTAAASDAQSKDAVLLEACRTVFQAGQTGFIESNQSSNNQGFQVLEILKSFRKE